MDYWINLLRSDIYKLNVEQQKSIYHSFHEMMYKKVFILLRDHQLTEDIIHESFIKVIEKAPKLKSATNMSAWIKKVVRNTTFDYYRKNKKYYVIQNYDSIEKAGKLLEKTVLSKQVENRMRNQLLYNELFKLNPKYRDVLILFYLEEKSYKEICKEIETSEQALAQTLTRARRKLYKHFSRKWPDVYI